MLVVQFLLPEKPESAKLLEPEEREWLAERQRELTLNAQQNDPSASSFWSKQLPLPFPARLIPANSFIS